MIPVLLTVKMATPESMKGTEKSTTASRSELIIKEEKATSTFRLINSCISPFHFPWDIKVPHRPSGTLESSYVNPISSANLSKRSIQNPEQHW